MSRFAGSLHHPSQLPAIAKEVPHPSEIVLAADQRQDGSNPPDLEGDVEALGLIDDLDREGLGHYKSLASKHSSKKVLFSDPNSNKSFKTDPSNLFSSCLNASFNYEKQVIIKLLNLNSFHFLIIFYAFYKNKNNTTFNNTSMPLTTSHLTTANCVFEEDLFTNTDTALTVTTAATDTTIESIYRVS